ncbi:LPXTG cell wall anchor domain-containing protein [Jiangella endophytica]|uniref:LPXTG cell wall anchor domain-containing protein n=1 Tax=Jiangella endophytica TaxID=1623398 RepID=UPI000E34C526|nr:LPXTG cell wall anchor domain-containing protein [Jiangella endophytica]
MAGAGLIGATALGLAAPAAADELTLDFIVDVQEISGYAGSTVQAYTSVANDRGLDIDGWSADFTVPDGATITGIAGEEFADGTERPDEGCALVTPQRVECHTSATLGHVDNVDTLFEVALPAGASGVIGAATYTVTPDEGAAKTAEADVTVLEPLEPDLVATLGPDFDIAAPPGAGFDQILEVTSLGGDMAGGSIDLTLVGGVTLTGITGLDLVDGGARPDEGCVVVDAQVQCHTNATLAQGATTEITFHLLMPATAERSKLGDATVTVTGDNGGTASDTQAVYLDVDPRVLEVTATPSVAGAAGDVVEIVVDAANGGPIGVASRVVDLVVPEGATIVGVEGFELVDESTWPDEGCALLSPRQVECARTSPPLLTGEAEQWTIEVRLDDDAATGELGAAQLTYRGGDEFYEAETVVTVTAGGGTASGGDGEELPDTGTSSTTVALAAVALLLAGGAAMTLRSRRA